MFHGFGGVNANIYSRETKQRTLEEVAAAFGDKVVLVTETDLAVEDAVMHDKADAIQLESTQGKPVQA